MICWTIAGSDSGGGAGIQADLKTFFALGVHGCSVITAITAQNSCSVEAVALTEPAMVRAQLQALKKDLPPVAIKTGMLANAETIELVAESLSGIDSFIVCDPVMVSTSGSSLMDPQARQALIRKLFPRVDLLTPNLPEARALCDTEIKTPQDIITCARQLLKMGVGSVLIKGGHGDSPISSDYWTNGQEAFWLHHPRINSIHTHGSGCTLSAAITALIASGWNLPDALVAAKAFVTGSIRRARPAGAGYGPVVQAVEPLQSLDLPWLSEGPDPVRLDFPDCGPEPLGLYPLVDRAVWLERFLPLGISTIQLRIKDLKGSALEREIKTAVEIANRFKARLFINDHWELAIMAKAYGVHLGQEDLNFENCRALEREGLRLGVSTHTYSELAHAMSLNPSYFALGPIFPTSSKELGHGPRGLSMLTEWVRLVARPVVAIGGIGQKDLNDLIRSGAAGIAVLSGLLNKTDPIQEAQTWMKILAQNR